MCYNVYRRLGKEDSAMRFPYKAYAEMVTQEESSLSRQVENSNAAGKKEISESVLENDDDVVNSEHDDIDEISGSDADNLVD